METKVTTKDLIGDLENFPIEVVEKMLEYQYKQLGKIDIAVFQKCKDADIQLGGFRWKTTTEGHDFWEKVINYEKFNLFFERYAKSKEVYICGDEKNGENIIRELESRGGVNMWNKMGNANYMLYYIDPVTNCIERAVDPQCKNLLRTYYTEILPGDYTMVELTMEQIAEKFGVDVNKLRIKK